MKGTKNGLVCHETELLHRTLRCDRLIISHPRLWMIDYDNDFNPTVCVSVCVLGGYSLTQLMRHDTQGISSIIIHPNTSGVTHTMRLCFFSLLSHFFFNRQINEFS